MHALPRAVDMQPLRDNDMMIENILYNILYYQLIINTTA